MAVELGQTVVEEEGTMDQGTVVQHLQYTHVEL